MYDLCHLHDMNDLCDLHDMYDLCDCRSKLRPFPSYGTYLGRLKLIVNFSVSVNQSIEID